MQRIDNTSPTLHYSWIGPPPDKNGIPGHDVDGPISMSTQNSTNPIVFWCLDAHKNHYEEIYKDKVNIQVKSVEVLLKEHTNDSVLKGRAEIMLTLMCNHLDSQKNTVRDRVTIKNIFTIYLLMTQGGYTLDTNIKPAINELVSLPHQAGFSVTKIEDERFKSTEMEPIALASIECFLMYSNLDSKNIKKAQNIFDEYSAYIKTTMERDKPDYDAGEKFIRFLHGQVPEYISARLPQSGGHHSIFDELPIVKYSFNTHKESNAPLPMIFNLVRVNDVELVTKMITNGYLNVQIDNNYIRAEYKHKWAGELFSKVETREPSFKNLNLLHWAILNNRIKIVEILLRNGIDYDSKVSFVNYKHYCPRHFDILKFDGEYSAIEIAEILSYKNEVRNEMVNLLKKFIDAQNLQKKTQGAPAVTKTLLLQTSDSQSPEYSTTPTYNYRR